VYDQQGFIQIISSKEFPARFHTVATEALLMDPLANERVKELTAAVKETVTQHSITIC